MDTYVTERTFVLKYVIMSHMYPTHVTLLYVKVPDIMYKNLYNLNLTTGNYVTHILHETDK